MVDEQQASAGDFGWDPTWLDLPPDQWDQVLVDAIEARQDWYGLPITGTVDEALYRRLVLERDHYHEPPQEPQPSMPQDCILVAGQLRPIAWPTVLTPGDEGGRGIEQYYRKGGRRRRRYKARSMPMPQVRRAVLHWTVTRSPAHSWRVAWGTRRSVSTHFEVGWDGTIWQLLDVQHQAFHSGIGWLNDASIGVDLTNPVGQKATARWNERLVEANQVARPVITDWRINGWDPGPFLGATEAQLAALAALADGLRRWCGVPLVAPLAAGHRRLKSRQVKGLSAARAAAAVPDGWVHHAEVMRGKWDHAGIYLPAIMQQAAEL
jgi:hypothetical protein